MNEIIRIDNVTVRYGDFCALDQFSLSVRESEFLTVIGRSGCGKTTALRLINGLVKPSEGTVTVYGENIADANLINLRRRIGYAIQDIGLFPHMTVRQNIAYVPSLSGSWTRKETAARTDALLETVGLPKEMAGRYPHELSGGQRQRVGIARALAAEPRIMLMDEPFGAVDEITRRSLQTEIIRLQKEIGFTAVFVTHDIDEALLLGTRILVMDAGHALQTGTPDEIRKNPADEFVAELLSNRVIEG